MKLFLYNNFHFGDILLNRSVILAVKSKYPETEIILGCESNKAYLWEDLGCEIQLLHKANLWTNVRMPIQDVNVPLDTIPHYLWFGFYEDLLAQHGLTYKNQSLSFNRTFEKYGMSLETNLTPKVCFKHGQDISTPTNSILVENSSVCSGQSQMAIGPSLLEQLTKIFPQYYFICSASPNISHPRILDFSRYNLIELSQIGNKAIAFITRGSGVNACTFTEINTGKPRFICGWVFSWKQWDENGMIYIKNDEELINSLRRSL